MLPKPNDKCADSEGFLCSRKVEGHHLSFISQASLNAPAFWAPLKLNAWQGKIQGGCEGPSSLGDVKSKSAQYLTLGAQHIHMPVSNVLRLDYF